MRRLAWVGALVLIAAAAIWLNNSSLWTAPGAKPTLLAHRGLAQTYGTEGLTATTCTAARIFPPEHGLIENTLPSMRAAFAAGADIVELDIHPTTDGQFAVFHDWTLDCRTDGKGVTREHSLPDLKRLDVGYGYTADGGKTWPFRGKGVGLMPSLDEVLAAFPDKRFLIHIKSNDPAEGRLLAARLQSLPQAQLQRLMIYGGALPVAQVRERLDVATMSGATLKRCLIRYLLLGWSGHVPADCERSLLLVPVNYAPWLWGWPNRFLARMNKHRSGVFVIGPHDGEDFSKGIDRVEDLTLLPKGYAGGIWTNRIDRIGPAIAKQ
ncbi:glycerophosphodiester phosphodiesterase [Bradyrhizobium lablabi]|uniref:glycerophosphodiester phosphodiesterase family protein n=1 Tax=Bradyrhizobium lablabi TaxID=722472 RepID=UPI001BA8609E|nr:glycerophosphodiester phosphodiesterase family protein [Bradyrhizobium lablabi]MBR1124418.1 glycerophosphodiester phosphodiesterase [Bradyrhizobium lablabi]